MNKDLPYFIALTQIPGIGAKRLQVLLKHFATAENIWQARDQILKQILDKVVYQKFKEHQSKVEPKKLLENIFAKGVGVLTLLDKNYPELLRQIFDPPPVLYFRGELLPSDKQALAVVGTRRITSYGREVTQMLVRDLAEYKLTIVSGLARGVDALAHKTALDSGTRTIAVLGSGVDVIYPLQNKQLAEEIIKNGALVSEYPPGTEPIPGHFPARNRIISGLSLGVLITEADEKSGSLITAGFALEQNREVFAVPGPIYSKLSLGPTELIKQGAKLVSKPWDIVEELNLSQQKKLNKEQIVGETKEEQKIIDLLENENKHIDQLLRESRLTTDKLNGLLVTMELAGKIKNLGSGNYSLGR